MEKSALQCCVGFCHTTNFLIIWHNKFLHRVSHSEWVFFVTWGQNTWIPLVYWISWNFQRLFLKHSSYTCFIITNRWALYLLGPIPPHVPGSIALLWAVLLACRLSWVTHWLNGLHRTIKSMCALTSATSDSLCPHGLQPARLLCPWGFPGKKTGAGCHLLLQEIFPTQGSNPRLLRWQVDSLPLSHQGSPKDCLRSIQLMYFISLAQNMQSLCFYLHFQYEEAWPETA